MNMEVSAPLPGSVLEILVKVGDEVKENDELLIIEAMKMENPIFASADGTVITSSAGSAVVTSAAGGGANVTGSLSLPQPVIPASKSADNPTKPNVFEYFISSPLV